ncbi:hypothetical protein EYC80_010176 [Monilinia laxa]|uniref:Uncharacterized protein n=1 Tax=Monilinia laxa TaxID=61186 RepID=A0A5N6JNS1_MONLA|nr:hypothetical protein EYC80_010176 [Monilinia laxa]
MTSTSIFASPVPAQPSTLATEVYGLSVHQVMDVANEPPSKAASTTPAGAKSTGTGSSCSPEVQALAEGISANIADQRNEQAAAAVTAMGYVLQESPLDASMFDAAKASLMNFVSKGIAIRENNQKITPEGNAATAGLAKVAMAQQEEFNLTMSLSANNVAASNATVEKLKADFAGGIMQNMKNLAAATKGCKMPNTAAAGAGTEAAPAKEGAGAEATKAGAKTEAGAGAGEAAPAKAGSAKEGAGAETTKAGSAEAGSAKEGAETGSAKAGSAEAGSEAASAMQMTESKRWI